MNKAIVSLGSNHNPEKYIPEAKKVLSKAFTILKESTFILTEPIGIKEPDLFLNGSILLETKLDSAKFKVQLKDIEHNIQQLAMKTGEVKRIIDLDLTIWNGEVLDPDYYKRSYLQKAVSELTEKS